MKQGIIVCTWTGGLEWANLCLDSLAPIKDTYPIYLTVNNLDNADQKAMKAIHNLWKTYDVDLLGVTVDGREVGAMRAVLENTDLDEFWLFQDTVEITDTSFIEETFKNHEGRSVSYSANLMLFYMGKWQRSVLEKIDLSVPTTKMEAIKYENAISMQYASLLSGETIICVDPNFGYGDYRLNYIDQNIFGEERFAVVGKYLIKRLSLVKENFRVPGSSHDNPEYMDADKIIEWRQHFNTMIRPSTGS